MKTDAAVKDGPNLKNKRVVLVLPGGGRLPCAGRDWNLGFKDVNFSRGSIEWRGRKVIAVRQLAMGRRRSATACAILQ